MQQSKKQKPQHKITKRLVDSLSPTSSLYELRDCEVIGFSIRITPAGVKSYCYQWRDASGRYRRETIGRHGTITPDMARSIAQQWAGIVAGGGDPSATSRQAAASRRVLMQDLFARIETEHLPSKKPRSALNDRGYWRNHILPAMGNTAVADVGPADAAALHLKLRATPTNANRVLEALRKGMNLAEVWKMRPQNSNPCKAVKPYRLKRRKRYLSPAEAPRLGAALEHFEALGGLDARFAALVRLTLYTGARKGEWMQARWDDLDTSRGVLRLPDTKSNEEQELIITPSAAEVLAGIQRVLGNPYIIAGGKAGQPLKETRRLWRRLCDHAGIVPGREGLRLHDTRHSFASYTLTNTGNLAMVGGLLRHADPQTTARYGHLLNDPLKAAAHSGASSIEELLKQPIAHNVITLKP